jgi:glycosyltransferase involved in cell wall biosynthesis
MKVAHVCTTALSHKILLDKLALMKEMGYEIHLISAPEGYDPQLVERYGFEVKFVPMRREIKPLADLLSTIRLASLLRKEKYEIVHTHTAKAGVVGRIAAWLARVPVVVHTTHGLPFYDGQSRLRNRLFRMLEKVGAWFGHAIASQNQEDMEKIREYAPGATVYYEGNGVDLDALDRRRSQITEEELDALRTEWQIPSGVPVLLMGARFEPVKDHAYLIDSLRHLKEHGVTNYVCVLAGRGELEDSIRSQVAAYGLTEQVRLVGHQLDIYRWIELSDIVVLSSEKEGIPRIVLEAMTYRKPIVATDVIGTREAVIHGTNGLLVNYKNVPEMAMAIGRLLAHEAYRRQLGDEGRSLVEHAFTERQVVARIHAYYGELFEKLRYTGKLQLPVEAGYPERSRSMQ